MSKRFTITKNLDIVEFEAVNEWGYARHKHNFFELTFILQGTGQHVLNNNTINYKEGDLFFLTPKDEHEFVIGEHSKFGIIKFTEQLFLEKASFSSNSYWRKNLETVIYHSNIIAESIIFYNDDKFQLFSLYNLIKNELNNDLVFNRNVLSELFGAMLVILSRNIKGISSGTIDSRNSNQERIEQILSYIRQNILDKERIRIQSIAETFYMSPNYVSIFIKKHAGISIQKYVIETKINMVKQLLKQNSLNVTEIADKIGFVDASHLNRIFKKHTGKNPSDFN